jgi:predicted DNA-binding transcriptional regulator AlpA
MLSNSRLPRSELMMLCDRIETLTLRLENFHKGLETLTYAVHQLAQQQGTRLTRTEVLKRLNVSNYTLNKMMDQKRFPRPGKDSKWLVAELLEWESRDGH